MNEQNLIPNSMRSKSEVRANSRKGGIKSGESRRRKKELKEIIEMMFEKEYSMMEGKTEVKMSGAEAIAMKQMEKALKGDTKAFEVLRDTAGQKPVEKVEQINIDAEYESRIKELKEMFADERNHKADPKKSV